MANEGMTKPTYSELEAELLRVRGLLQRLADGLNGMIATFESGDHADKSSEFGRCADGICAICDAEAALDAAMSDIQIPTDAKSDNIPQAGESEDENVLCAFCPTRSPDHSMKACLEAGKCLYPDKPIGHFAFVGAESADIGKLDAADDHAVCPDCHYPWDHCVCPAADESGKVNRVDECKHEKMWFSRTIEEDGSMHYFCEDCGRRDDEIDSSAPYSPAPLSTQLDATKEKV